MTEKRNICQNDGEACQSCWIKGKLMCSFSIKDTLFFVIPVFGAWIGMIIGVIASYKLNNLTAGHLLAFFGGYIFYLFVFFQIWENKILCSHCPYYVFEDEMYVKCYANYGIHKAWKYNPAPMTKSEQLQFLLGIFIFVGYPLVFLIMGKSYLHLVITMAFDIIWLVSMYFLRCSKCPNFSCPLNNVPKNVVDDYLRQNDVMRDAWERSGYKLE